jgi:hypothetical protein
MKFSLTLLTAFGLLSMVFTAASSEEYIHPSMEETFYISLGAYFLDAEVEYSETKTGEPRQSVNLDDLGIDGNSVTPMIELGWRFKQRWSLTANYFLFDESGKLRNEREFIIGDTVFPVGIALDSTVRVDTYILNLGYSLFKNQNSEFGLGIGIHGFDFNADIQGRATIGENQFPFVSESQDFIAPLPNIRVFGSYAFNSRWHASFKGGWLSADIGDYSGEMWIFDTKFEFRATKSLGLGVGYMWNTLDVEVEKKSRIEKYDLEFNGPLLYLSYSF